MSVEAKYAPFEKIPPQERIRIIASFVYAAARANHYDFTTAYARRNTSHTAFWQLSFHIAFFLDQAAMPSHAEISDAIRAEIVDLYPNSGDDFVTEEAKKGADFYHDLNQNLFSSASFVFDNNLKANVNFIQNTLRNNLEKNGIQPHILTRNVNQWLKSKRTQDQEQTQEQTQELKQKIKNRITTLTHIQEHSQGVDKEELAIISQVLANLEKLKLEDIKSYPELESTYQEAIRPFEEDKQLQNNRHTLIANAKLMKDELNLLKNNKSEQRYKQIQRLVENIEKITRDSTSDLFPTEIRLLCFKALKTSNLETHTNADIKRWCGRFKQVLGLAVVAPLYFVTFGQIRLLARHYESLKKQAWHNQPKTQAEAEILFSEKLGITPAAPVIRTSSALAA